MGLFKKQQNLLLDFHKRFISLFKESVKEINELYDDAKAEYEDIESVAAEFAAFTDELKGRIDSADSKKLEDFARRLARVDSCAKRSVRDIRDVLRNQKKMLRQMQNDFTIK